MSAEKEIRRKHSAVDLQQDVTSLDVYKRPLNSSSGKAAANLGFPHEAAVATTSNGRLYLIEKGVSHNDDVNYKNGVYREGECRIAQITENDMRDWIKVRSVEQVKPGVPLEDYVDACGSNYNLVTDNCWNGTQRMRVCANDSEDGVGVGLTIGGAIAVASVAGKDKKPPKQ